MLENLRLQDLLESRLVTRDWNKSIIFSNVLERKSCFALDGRHESISLPYLLGEETVEDSLNSTSSQDSEFATSPSWNHLRLRRVTTRGGRSWIHDFIDSQHNKFKTTVTTLELLNCTLNWAVVLQLLSEFENLNEVRDTQDMYCWDYATFNSGLSEDEAITENPGFLAIPRPQKLTNLSRLKKAIIHRSQLSECSTYIKILSLYCSSLGKQYINVHNMLLFHSLFVL